MGQKTTTSASVAVARVLPRDIVETVAVTGTLQPASEVSVGPRYAGKLVWVIGKTGTRVKQGQVVARIDMADARIQLNAAKAALQAAQARVEQAQAAVTQQKSSTDSGIQNAQAALDGAQARAQQAETSYTAMVATTNAQIAQAEQALKAAKSRLATLTNGSRSQEKLIAENNKRLAEATLNNDKRSYERYQQLYTQGAVAKSTLDSAETKLQISQAQYDSAVQQASLVNEGPRQEDIDTAQASVAQAQAALDSANAGKQQVDVAKDNVAIAKTGVAQAKAALQAAKASMNIDVMRDKDVLAARAAIAQSKETVAAAEQMLDNTNVYSPVDGVVAERTAEVGQSLGANATVLRITTDNALYFEAQLSELDATRVRMGQSVLVIVDALQSDRTNLYKKKAASSAIAGTVERVVPVVDQRTRNFTVRVLVRELPNLFPGMFARGEVVVARHALVPSIPKDAVRQKGDRQYVLVAEKGIARQRTLLLGASDDQYIQVLSGLQEGEQLITAGPQSLADGDAIKITDASQQ